MNTIRTGGGSVASEGVPGGVGGGRGRCEAAADVADHGAAARGRERRPTAAHYSRAISHYSRRGFKDDTTLEPSAATERSEQYTQEPLAATERSEQYTQVPLAATERSEQYTHWKSNTPQFAETCNSSALEDLGKGKRGAVLLDRPPTRGNQRWPGSTNVTSQL